MENWYSTLPKKRSGTGALIFDKNGNLLVLKTSYKSDYTIPGGVIDDWESPLHAIIREIREEIGLDIHTSLRLGCIDYRTHPEKGESYQFVFDAGTLSDEEIQKIKIDGKEIVSFQFLPVDKALLLFPESSQKRFSHILNDRNKFFYLEAGALPEGIK